MSSLTWVVSQCGLHLGNRRKKGQNNGSINRKLGLSFQFQVFQTAK